MTHDKSLSEHLSREDCLKILHDWLDYEYGQEDASFRAARSQVLIARGAISLISYAWETRDAIERLIDAKEGR